MVSVHGIATVVKKVLETWIVQEAGIMSKGQCETLLLSEETFRTLPAKEGKYPRYPLYLEISKKLYQWMTTGNFPAKSQSCGSLSEEDFTEERKEISEKIWLLLSSLNDSWTEISDKEKCQQFSSILKFLGVRGLLDLLNIRRTQGSVDIFPSPVEVLIESFNKKHRPNANLTVGARALSKHCHRDSSEWWGVCAGSEQVKNEHANTVVMRILEDASWINIHCLPHGLKVIEVRCIEGYGARWSYDGKVFRGFLEPQMEDGHAVGWKH
ncbi:uncharacterized protein LOC111339424 [Stylophora pistillata]|uniref:uncharacterized protein LOC111339424 n=1 Tax=Stylophora pistillata TaxID=50429 RepID=UPI000C04626F|nr:uncharacterized protein LOC111339424 [Stylophora pistillata]